MVRKALLFEDSLPIAENIKSSIVNKGAFNTTRTPHSNHNENKRRKGGNNTSKDKKIKVEEEPSIEYCKFCDKSGQREDACWKEMGACLRCGSHDHHIPNCPMLKDQNKGKQGASKRQGNLNVVIQAELPTGGGNDYEELENDGTGDEC
ncbi:hypothetical protein Taro_042757 [Colocasia esculenta]|uniref:CCHC-type domain-containing protein n=1 Tax=Colocasia esculenta TaxID=4460 RepID=A0A843WTQ8_COLES|nr:hypothetical protein [Colocasia esculenta]